MKSIYEAIMENFLNLAKLALTDGRTLMMTGGLDILDVSAIALILVFLTAKMAQRKRDHFRAGSAIANNRVSDGFFGRKPIPTLKPCPNCAEQLPLSALFCDGCDYNFLAVRPGRGQKLLASPQPMTLEVSEQRFACAVL
jgi:hypothetical protein